VVGREKGRFQRRFWLEKRERPRGKTWCVAGEKKEKESCGGLVCGGRGGRLREGRPGVWLVRRREKSDEEGGGGCCQKWRRK
jgi:hypothetical protein